MFESITSFNMVEHLCDATFVPPTGRWGYARQLDPVRQPMRTKDGYISIAPYVDDRWVRFFQAAGHPQVLEEERFIDKPTRRKNMTQMYEVAETILPEKTTAEWLTILKEAHVPAMRASEIGDVLDDPHLNAGGFFRSASIRPKAAISRCASRFASPAWTIRTPGTRRRSGRTRTRSIASSGSRIESI